MMELSSVQFSSVQSLSHVRLFATPWIAACQASLSITNSLSLLKLMSIESVIPSSHLILCHPHLLLPPIPPSIRVFSNKSAFRIRWPKYCSFSLNISPSKEHPGLISFRMDWLALIAVQGTLKSLLQHHSSKASILRHSAFFTVKLSHPYMTTGKIIVYYLPSNSTLEYKHQRIGRKVLKKCWNVFVIATLFSTAKKWRHSNVHWQMSQQTKCGAYPYSRILLSLNKEENSDTGYSSDEPWKN